MVHQAFFGFTLLAVVCASIDARQGMHKLRCDVLTHLSKNRFIGRPSDVLELREIRLFSIGLDGKQLEQLFQCAGHPVAFTASPNTIVRGAWSFGPEIRVLELTPAHEWKEAQWEEYNLRTTGYLTWDQAPASAGNFRRLLGYSYDYNWMVDAHSIPFAIVHGDSRLTLSQLNARASHPNHLPVLTWSSAGILDLADAVKTLVIKQARDKENSRIASKARDEGHRAGQAACRLEKSTSEQDAYKRGLIAGQQVNKDAAYARGLVDAEREVEVNVHRHTRPSTPIALDNHWEDVCELILCPITLQPMRDAVVNTRTGHSYDNAAIRAALAQRPADPMTGEETDLDDLQPNWRLRHLIAEIESHC